MTRKDRLSFDAAQAMADQFGGLSLTMLYGTPLSPAWQINFLANFFTGPIYRELADRFGLSRPEFVILFCLQQRPGLVARDICLVTGLPKNSISRALSELLTKGFVERETDDADKRAKPLIMTSSGQDVLANVVPLFEARQAAMRAVLSDDEQAVFDRLLSKIIYAMPEWVETE